MFRSFCLAAVLLCLSVAQVLAAQFDVRPSPSGSWIYVRGPFVLEDGARFQKILATTPDAAVVALESDGGRLIAGLDIGNAIRARQLSTVVLDATQCASACAVAWLGGTRRYMGPNARIGFHAAYRADRARGNSESGVGNAVLGAYLSRLGLSDRAVIHITQAAPNQITWLTMRDAKALDIDVLPFLPTTAQHIVTPQPQAGAGPGVGQVNQEQAARQFVFDHYAQTAQVGILADEYVRAAYAERVSVGGVFVPRENLLAARRRMGERWPEQAYTIRPDTVRVKCADVGLCDVTGVVDWEWSSWARGARSNGSANFAFQITFEGDTPVIRGESEAVFAQQGSGPQ